ncbi:hypothetical protein [uncultured Gilvimarinus sp.]|uniref:hypothetical protein n=1 Tax=uncultured Gilvimarinus sp. TaxID=1689143 RepID=UPI0030EC0AD2|tara:strand:+ start:9037 stop:9309 length:273 start_codon:yes stop_codon:yes gene_type:complete
MYHDPRDVRYIRKATYLSENEREAIEKASAETGRQPAAFMRDAAMAVSRYVLGQSGAKQKPDLIQAVQTRLQGSRPTAANDEISLFSLAI